MRKVSCIVAAGAVALAIGSTQSVRAELCFNTGFDYDVGDLHFSNGAPFRDGETGDRIQVVKRGAHRVKYNQLLPLGELPRYIKWSGHGRFASRQNGLNGGNRQGNLYVSFLLRVNAIGEGGWILRAHDAPGGSWRNPKIYVGPADSNPKRAQVGISLDWNPVKSPKLLKAGKTYLIVMKVESGPGPNDDLVKLWVNPWLGQTEVPAPDVVIGPQGKEKAIGTFTFVQWLDDDTTVSADTLRFAVTDLGDDSGFDEVAPLNPDGDTTGPEITCNVRDIKAGQRASFRVRIKDPGGISSYNVTATSESDEGVVTVKNKRVRIRKSGPAGNVITIDVTATDGHGNTSEASFVVNVTE